MPRVEIRLFKNSGGDAAEFANLEPELVPIDVR